MAQSDLRLAGDAEPRNETARLRGGPHVRQSRGRSLIGVVILPENLPPRQAGNASFPQRRSYAGVTHRSLEPGLEPEGKAVPIVHHQLVLVLPRPRLRSCRRPLHASPASGRYSLPRPVLDRLQAALAPAKNREAALVLAVFLARYWTSPGRLELPFPADRRALCGHRDLPLTETRVRGAIKLLEEVGFLEREEP